jgi:N-acetylglucosamine-6-phosphate deacetylase
MRTLIHSARAISEGSIRDDAWVLFDGDRIAATGQGVAPALSRGPASEGGAAEIPDTEIIDAAGRWLTPGFVDLHCHGAGGASFDNGADEIRTGLGVHRLHGSTRTAISLVSASIPVLLERLRSVVVAAGIDPLILGAHLEGPFLDVGHKGAHDPRLLQSATPEAVEAVLAAGEGRISQITLAPELPGGMAAIGAFTAAGVAVAVGHTDADYDRSRAAFDAGATILTHAFNGMEGIHHRAPGPVAAAMATPGVTLELINDGIHVHPEIVRLTFAGAPGRIALVTDAMAAAGASDGDYVLGGLDVVVAAGVARLREGGAIAGSTLFQDEALRLAVRSVGLPIEVAVHALTEAPARAVGRGGDLGRLAAGYAADAVLLDEELSVSGVWAAGVRIR